MQNNNPHKVTVWEQNLICALCQKNEWLLYEVGLNLLPVEKNIGHARQLFECANCGELRMFASTGKVDAKNGYVERLDWDIKE